MKKIRIDFYQYRVRKGRIDILLERDGTNNSFYVPFHYVLANEWIHPEDFWLGHMEDDGDLVIRRCSINNCHLHKNNKEWIPLLDIQKIKWSNNKTKKVIQYCLAFFLEMNPQVEDALVEKVKKQLEEHLTDRAKEGYVDELTQVLNGDPIFYPDVIVTPPDPKLLAEEIKTMAHFQLIKMDSLNFSYHSLKYSYKPIPWEKLGAKIIGIMNLLKIGEDL